MCGFGRWLERSPQSHRRQPVVAVPDARKPSLPLLHGGQCREQFPQGI